MKRPLASRGLPIAIILVAGALLVYALVSRAQMKQGEAIRNTLYAFVQKALDNRREVYVWASEVFPKGSEFIIVLPHQDIPDRAECAKFKRWFSYGSWKYTIAGNDNYMTILLATDIGILPIILEKSMVKQLHGSDTVYFTDTTELIILNTYGLPVREDAIEIAFLD